jgi:hypothetical protein
MLGVFANGSRTAAKHLMLWGTTEMEGCIHVRAGPSQPFGFLPVSFSSSSTARRKPALVGKQMHRPHDAVAQELSVCFHHDAG